MLFSNGEFVMSRSTRGKVWLGAAGLVMNSAGEWLVVKKSYSALKGKVSDNLAFFLLSPVEENQLITAELKEIAEVAWKSPLELKEDENVSVMIHEIADKIIDSGFDEILNVNPGDAFGYTSYKLFFKG